MKDIRNRRSVLRWTALAAAAATLSACHAHWHVPPGQVKKQHTPLPAIPFVRIKLLAR